MKTAGVDLEQCLSMLSGELAEDGAWSLEEAGATGAQRQRREWEQAEIREASSRRRALGAWILLKG